MSNTFSVMLAKTYDPERVQSWREMYAEPKLDGVRVIVLVPRAGATPRYYSRNGRELGMFTHMNPSIRRVCDRLARCGSDMRGGLMFDTEAVGMTFGDVSGAIHTKGTVAVTCRLHMFHAMPIACFRKGMDDASQLERVERLQLAIDGASIKGITVPEPHRVLDHNQVLQVHRRHRAFDPSTGKPKFEGTMVKNLYAGWCASRSWAWMKIKEKETVEVIVTGLKEGKGKYAGTCGALMCDHNGRKVRCSGMTDAQRDEFWKHPKHIVGKMVEVEYQEETESGSLRHIRFKRVRDDKQE